MRYVFVVLMAILMASGALPLSTAFGSSIAHADIRVGVL